MKIIKTKTKIKINIKIKMKIKMKINKKNDKIYFYYSFNNLTNVQNTNSSSLPFMDNDYDDDTILQNEVMNLYAFIDIVLKSLNPKKTGILIKISSPGGCAYTFEL